MNSRRGKEAGDERVSVRELKIINRLGLHARPAALFVKTASRFESEVVVEKEGNAAVSGKSIMGLMTLEAALDTVLKVTARGPDAEQVLDELASLVANKFLEE